MAEAPWLVKLLQAFESKPAFTGVLASALCLLIVGGIVYTDNPNPSGEAQTSTQVSQLDSPMAAMAPAFLDASAPQSGMIISTNPSTSLEPSASPFGNPNPLLQPVSFNH